MSETIETEGFDMYTSAADGALFWDTFTFNMGAAFIPGGRFGGKALGGNNQATTTKALKTLKYGATTSFVWGFAVYRTTTGATGIFARVLDAGTEQLTLSIDSTGHLVVKRGTSTTLGTSTNAMSLNTWYHIAWKVTIDNSAGISSIYVDEVDWLTLTAQDTQATGNATVNQIEFDNLVSFSNSDFFIFDDMYFENDGNGVPTFRGDNKVVSKAANANGSTNNFTPSAGTNYQNVDDASPDGDTTYNASQTPGDKDLYGMADFGLSSAAVVNRVMHKEVVRKDDTGTRKIKLLCKSGSTTEEGTEETLTTSYKGYSAGFSVDPNAPTTGWLPASTLDSAEFGLEVSA